MDSEKFQEIAEERDLTVLNKDQLNTLLGAIHAHGSAHATNVAFNRTTFMYQSGNLDYYTGLSYEQPDEIRERGSIKIYVAGEDDDDRTKKLGRMCRAIIKGEDPREVSDYEEGDGNDPEE